MNDHEATELLERLVEPLHPGDPAIWELLERGRRARGRRRAFVMTAAAAAVAAVVGSTAMLAEQFPGSSGGASSVTSPADEVGAAELNPADLLGSWEPRVVLGEEIGSAPDLPGISFQNDRVVATPDGCELTTARYSVGPEGELATSELTKAFPYCVSPEAVTPIANEEVIRRATRLVVKSGVLTVYDERGSELAVYDRDWAEVEAADLLGRWRLATSPDGRTITLDELKQSLEREALRRRALVTFEEDGYQAVDGINTTSGRYEVGKFGEFRDWDPYTTQIGCADAAVRDPGESTATDVEPMPLVPPIESADGDCERVPNPEILASAVRVQGFDSLRLLVFYGEDGMSIGVYSKVR